MAPDKSTSNGRKNTRRWLYAAIIGWGISFIIVAAFGTYVVIRGQQINSSLCRVTDDNRDLLKKLLDTSEQQALSRTTDFFERNIIRQNINQLRALIPPLQCTTAGGPQELEP